MSRALDILTVLQSRLAAISVAGGYNTNAGAKVYMGRAFLDADKDVPSLTLHEGRPTGDGFGFVENTSNNPALGARMSPEYTVEGLIAIGADAQITAAHKLLSDIKKALWGVAECGELAGTLNDHRFVGHAVLPHQAGSNRMAVAVVGAYSYIENFAAP